MGGHVGEERAIERTGLATFLRAGAVSTVTSLAAIDLGWEIRGLSPLRWGVVGRGHRGGGGQRGRSERRLEESDEPKTREITWAAWAATWRLVATTTG